MKVAMYVFVIKNSGKGGGRRESGGGKEVEKEAKTDEEFRSCLCERFILETEVPSLSVQMGCQVKVQMKHNTSKCVFKNEFQQKFNRTSMETVKLIS